MELSYVRDLHIFRYEDGFLMFHPDTYSLFRVGAGLGRILQELQECDNVAELAARHHTPADTLQAKLAVIEGKINHNRTSIEPRPPEGDPRNRKVGLTLNVSNACNLACVYCYANGGDYGRQEKTRMERGLALKSIDTMYRNFAAIDSIMFFGGEPTLAMDIIEAVC